MYSISIFLFYILLIGGVRTQRTPLPTGLRAVVRCLCLNYVRHKSISTETAGWIELVFGVTATVTMHSLMTCGQYGHRDS